MKYLFLCLSVYFLASKATAQYVGLSDKEVSGLAKLIKKNNDAKNLYNSLKKIADKALNQKPNPVDTVVSEGHLATDPKKIKTQQSLKDIDKIYALAFAYRIEKNNSYLNKLIEYITAWATINKPQGNPINDTKFENLFIAYDLVKNNFLSSSKNIINSWLIKMADEEINTAKNKAKKTSYNNWNSHRLKVISVLLTCLITGHTKNTLLNSYPCK